MIPLLRPISTNAVIDYLSDGIEEFLTRQPVQVPRTAAPEVAQMLVIREYVAHTFSPSPATRFGSWIEAYDPYSLPIQVCGVTSGTLTTDGTGVQTFANITEARRTFPDLRLRDLSGHPSRFSGPMRGELEGAVAIRYETTAACLFFSE